MSDESPGPYEPSPATLALQADDASDIPRPLVIPVSQLASGLLFIVFVWIAVEEFANAAAIGFALIIAALNLAVFRRWFWLRWALAIQWTLVALSTFPFAIDAVLSTGYNLSPGTVVLRWLISVPPPVAGIFFAVRFVIGADVRRWFRLSGRR